MKKTIYNLAWMLIISAIFSGCEKKSYVAKFDELPQERMKNQIDLVKHTLTEAENGWVATLPTSDGGGYAFFMAFDTASNVNMVGDLTDPAASTPQTSKYRVRDDMGAALTFGTYNYISILNNPDENAFGGKKGTGFRSDIDFIYDHSSKDSIVFIGKRYRQPFTLVKASADQEQQYLNGEYKNVIHKFKQFFEDNPNLYFELGDIKVSVEANSSNDMNNGKRLTFTAIFANDSIVSVTEKFAFIINEMTILNEGLIYEDLQFVSLKWKDSKTLALYDASGKEYILKNSTKPLLPLYKLWGSKYSGMFAGYMLIYPGTSQKGTDILNFYSDNLCGYLPYCFNYGDLTFKWDIVNQRLELDGFESQNGGSSGWTTSVVYDYTKDENGVYSFTTAKSHSGGYVWDIMEPMDDFLLNNQVQFDYYVDGSDVYAMMSSVTHPDIVMTFVLQ